MFYSPDDKYRTDVRRGRGVKGRKGSEFPQTSKRTQEYVGPGQFSSASYTSSFGKKLKLVAANQKGGKEAEAQK